MPEQSSVTSAAIAKATKIHWPSVIVTASLTLVASVASAMIISYLQSRDPDLVYSALETIPFPGEKRVVAIYQITLANEGKKTAEDVTCVIRVPNATIEQQRTLADPSIVISQNLSGDSIRLNFPLLNPQDTVNISLMASAESTLPSLPQVALRSRGFAGREKRARSQDSFRTYLPIAAIASVAVVVFSVLSSQTQKRMREAVLRSREKGERLEDKQDDDDQKDVLAYLCGIYGLNSESERYLSLLHQTKYWVEADRLSTLAVESNDSVLRNKVKKILGSLPDFVKLAERTHAFVLYDMARVSIACGERSEAVQFLKEAKDIRPNLIAKRLRIDPVMKALDEKE